MAPSYEEIKDIGRGSKRDADSLFVEAVDSVDSDKDNSDAEAEEPSQYFGKTLVLY